MYHERRRPCRFTIHPRRPLGLPGRVPAPAPATPVEVAREAWPLLALVVQGGATDAEQLAGVDRLQELLVQGDRRGLHAGQLSPLADVGMGGSTVVETCGVKKDYTWPGKKGHYWIHFEETQDGKVRAQASDPIKPT